MGQRSWLFIGIAALHASAFPFGDTLVSRDVRPTVKSVTILANVTDPAVTRDSCGSTKIGQRLFWTCRDTQPFVNNQAEFPVITNTAAWSDLNSDSSPVIIHNAPVGDSSNGKNPVHLLYGGHSTTFPAYFPVLQDECPQSGACNDSTRWAIWPDSPILITSGSSSTTTGYTWIIKAHLKGLAALDPTPPTTLYKSTYTPSSDRNALPSVKVVAENFWPEDHISYGHYGNLIPPSNPTYAYLYGQTTSSPRGTTLARVPLSSIEDTSTYTYYVPSTKSWSKTAPPINSTTGVIPNAGTSSQGTFFYSKSFNTYMWIGQGSGENVADFWITTAPAPEGPWVKPYFIYKGANGDNPIAGGYTLQANLGMGEERDGKKGVYVTWTEQFANGTYQGYVTPLAFMELQ